MSERFVYRSLCCLAALAVIIVAGGCTPKADDPDLVLAVVGDRPPVTAQYYQERLARLKQENIPRGEDGQPMDMSSLEGKRAFLNIIIDKELMVSKALQAGYLEDPRIDSVRRGMLHSASIDFFWRDHGRDPDKEVPQAQIDHHYSRLGESRRCNYLIASTEDEARQARQALLGGTPWDEVTARYHHDKVAEGRVLEMEIHWGQSREEYQRPVFGVEEGGITEPFETHYGWWVVQVNTISFRDMPPLDAMREQIVSSIKTQEDQILREQVIRRIKEDRNFQMNDEALAIVLAGLPEREGILDPETRQPIPRDQLKPLQLSTTDYDKVLMSYDLITGPVEVTLVDYKMIFDRQNVFDRPKKAQGLLALRSRIETEEEQVLIADEARRLGYLEDPRVHEMVFSTLEELLVDRVNEELVRFDDHVPMSEIVDYYEEHEDAYWKAEHRTGTLLNLTSENLARQAREDWLGGTLSDRVEQLSVGPFVSDANRPVNAMLFELEPGATSAPFRMPDGWGVVRLDSIVASQRHDLNTVREHVAKQIRDRRQEQELRRLLDRWGEEFGVKVYEDRLAKMPSWEEVVASGMSR